MGWRQYFKKYEKQIIWDLYYEDFKLKVIESNAHLKKYRHIITGKFGFSAIVVLVRIFVSGYEELKSSWK